MSFHSVSLARPAYARQRCCYCLFPPRTRSKRTRDTTWAPLQAAYLAHASAGRRGLEHFGGRIIKHEPRRELLSEGELPEHWENMEAVADPVRPWRGYHFANDLGHCCNARGHLCAARARLGVVAKLRVHGAHGGKRRVAGCSICEEEHTPQQPRCAPAHAKGPSRPRFIRGHELRVTVATPVAHSQNNCSACC
jgi:hypothetical protein